MMADRSDSSDATSSEKRREGPPPDDRGESGDGDAPPSRRSFLAATGTLALGSAFGAGTATAERGGERSAPDSFREFERAVADTVEGARPVVDRGPYEPTRDSLGSVDETPEWFRDAKFGIWFHWGLYSVPAYETEWYPRYMYDTDHDVYEYHVENYGEPDEHPYQEFAPEFTAEAFDADRWVGLFEEAGARFTGPVAEHHDGWSNWDSAINPWNAADRGPERDLTGELAAAADDRGLRFVAALHHARRALPWDESDFESTSPAGLDGHYSFAYENFPSVAKGFPERVMYANVSTDLFMDAWLAKVVEVVDQYQPDLLWFDNALESVPSDYQYRALAYFYNRAAESDRDVMATHKQNDLPDSTSAQDFELGRPRDMQERAWLMHTTLSEGAWSYTADQTYKSAEQVLHVLVDCVSKNGQMLLNVSPRADGTIPEVQRDRLREVGEWLDRNGDAVYGTRPWDVFGEGPTRLEEGGAFIGSVEYTPEDVRYTRSKDGETLYAVVLGWPEDGSLTPEALRLDEYDSSDGGDVTLVGHGSVEYSVDTDGRLTIDVPDLSASERPSDHAVVFALTGFDAGTAPADLAVSAADVAFTRTDSETVHVAATVRNEGYSPARETAVTFFEGEERLASRTVSVPARGSTAAEFDWRVGGLDCDAREIRVVVDPENRHDEPCEKDNAATAALSVSDLDGE